MKQTLTRLEALEAAIETAGSQTKFARDLGTYQTMVWRWINQSKQLPAEYVLEAERLYGVSRHELRPDIYPRRCAQESDKRFYAVDQDVVRVA